MSTYHQIAQSQEVLYHYEKDLTVKQVVDAEQTKLVLLKLGKVDCIIVDHYAIDTTWEEEIRPYVQKIMVIDDLANRKHTCDILLDQNYDAESDNKYKNKVPESCKLFLGLEYLLFRQEFHDSSAKCLNHQVKNILCFFGGGDISNQTEKFLDVISCLRADEIQIHVVVGGELKKKYYKRKM